MMGINNRFHSGEKGFLNVGEDPLVFLNLSLQPAW